MDTIRNTVSSSAAAVLVLVCVWLFSGSMGVLADDLANEQRHKLSRLFEYDVSIESKDTKADYDDKRIERPFQRVESRRFQPMPAVARSAVASLSKILVVVDDRVNRVSEIGARILRYIDDIQNHYGCAVAMEVVSGGGHADIKSLILSHRTDLDGVVFFGDFPAAWFEIENDFGEYGYKQWPCDLYYMDLDGVWEDLYYMDINGISEGMEPNGIFDTHSGDVKPEIFVGRIDTAHMGALLDEVDGMIRYLDKNHRYWLGALDMGNKKALAYMDKDWASGDYEQNHSIENLYGAGDYENINYYDHLFFGVNDYLNNRLTDSNYGFVQIAAHSNSISHNINGEYLTADTIFNANPQAIGYNLFSCSALRWTGASETAGYLGGAYVFNGSQNALSVIGSTKIGGMLNPSTFYKALNQDKSLGRAHVDWWEADENPNVSWSYGMTIIGDPMINFIDEKVLGHQEIFAAVTTFPNRRAVQYTMPENGNIQSVAIYHAGGSGRMLLGVYKDNGSGAPGKLLSMTSPVAVNADAGWQTIALDEPAYVLGGAVVWLAWVFENNPGIRYRPGLFSRADAGAGWSGGMPEFFGSSSFADYEYSIHATYFPYTQVCNAPSNLYTANSTQTTAMIKWEDMLDACGYEYRYRRSGTTVWISGTTTDSSLEIGGLTAQTEYAFEVKTVCSEIESDFSTMTFTTLQSCDPPDAFQASELTDASATIVWDAPAGADEYFYKYKAVSDPIWSQDAYSAAPSAGLSGLAPATDYEIQVKSYCNHAPSGWSASFGFKTAGGAGCDRPANLYAANATQTIATITWDDMPEAQRYTYRYRVLGAAEWSNGTTTGHMVELVGLTAQTEYEFEAKTICMAGESDFAVTTFTTLRHCDPPGAFQLSDLTGTSVTIAWDAPAGADEYFYRYKLASDATWPGNIYTGSAFADLSGLESGMDYEFQVKSYCHYAPSEWSAPYVFTTQALR